MPIGKTLFVHDTAILSIARVTCAADAIHTRNSIQTEAAQLTDRPIVQSMNTFNRCIYLLFVRQHYFKELLQGRFIFQ